jgi:hypothetical protein
MDFLVSLLNATIDFQNARALAILLFFLPIFYFSHWAIKRGAKISLRPIASYASLKRLLANAAETGQPIHLSLGTAGVGDAATADTMAGLTVLQYLADRAAVSAAPPIVTMSNPTALPIAQDVLRRAYRRHGYAEEYAPTRVRMIAPDPALGTTMLPAPAESAAGQGEGFPYAAGVMRLLTNTKLTANVMVGRFGDEFLLMAETGAQKELNQIGGTSSERVLPFVYTSISSPLIGEEIYAAGAYLGDQPGHVSSLTAQDAMRWLLILGLIIAIGLHSVGWM